MSTQSRIINKKINKISSRWGVRNNKKNSAKERKKNCERDFFFLLKAIGRNWEATVIKLFVHSLYVENAECVGHPRWKIALRKVHGRGISDQINWREVFLSLWKCRTCGTPCHPQWKIGIWIRRGQLHHIHSH